MDTKKSIDKQLADHRNMYEDMFLNQDKIYKLRLSHGVSPECLFENFPLNHSTTQKKKIVKT